MGEEKEKEKVSYTEEDIREDLDTVNRSWNLESTQGPLCFPLPQLRARILGQVVSQQTAQNCALTRLANQTYNIAIKNADVLQEARDAFQDATNALKEDHAILQQKLRILQRTIEEHTKAPVSPRAPDIEGFEQDELFAYEGGCDAVWCSFLIKTNGDIYPCCYAQVFPSLKLGNVNKMKFEDIWRSEKVERLRECSRQGYMPCPTCGVPSWRDVNTEFDFPNKPFRSRPPELSDIIKVQIEPSQFCNGRCYMCGLDLTDKTEIDYEALIKSLENMNLKMVNLVGGEAFYAPNIDSFLAWLYKAPEQTEDLKISMTSNGAIPEKRTEELVKHYSRFDITFLGTTSEVEKAVSCLNLKSKIKFVKSLVKARDEYDYSHRDPLSIGIAFTIVPTNFHQIPDAITLAEDLGVDYLVYNYDFFIADFMRRYPALVERVRKAFEKKVWEQRDFKIDARALKPMNLI